MKVDQIREELPKSTGKLNAWPKEAHQLASTSLYSHCGVRGCAACWPSFAPALLFAVPFTLPGCVPSHACMMYMCIACIARHPRIFVLICFVSPVSLLPSPALAMQITPEVIKTIQHDLATLTNTVNQQTEQLADHAAKLEKITAAIAELASESKATADTVARSITMMRELIYNWGLLIEEHHPVAPPEANQGHRQPPPPPPPSPPLCQSPPPQPQVAKTTTHGSQGIIHPCAPQACLDDPFTELRVWESGGGRPDLLWPYCTGCSCWTDDRHQDSKRHQKALAHWYPDLSLSACCPGLHATSLRQPAWNADSQSGKTHEMQVAVHSQPSLPQANPGTAPTAPCTNQPVSRTSPLPLFSTQVDKLQHDAFCCLFKPRPCEVLTDLSQSLGLTGISFQEWWHQVAPTGSPMQWQIKLWAHGTPKELVADADEDRIGQLLYYHIDFEGSYHADPLQASPPTA